MLTCPAQKWATRMHEERQTRPSFRALVDNHNGQTPAKEKDVAWVVAHEGVAKLQLAGGVIDAEAARALQRFLYDAFTVVPAEPAPAGHATGEAGH